MPSLHPTRHPTSASRRHGQWPSCEPRRNTYGKLRGADYPLNVAFDLWQEQARVFLQHLGVPRWELMEAFQARPQGAPSIPTDSSVAGEYWEMSTHETAIVVATGDNTAAKQR